MFHGLELHPSLREVALAAPEAWSRGRTWCNLGPDDVPAMRAALRLAQGIVEEAHQSLDYRTFSRRATGDSKALERLEAAVLRLVAGVIDVPPASGPRAALAALGLERFSPPLLVAGQIGLDMPSLPYLGKCSPAGSEARRGQRRQS